MTGLPTVISFYCGDRYYHECGAQLAADCRRLDIPHDIEELHVRGDRDWSQITRAKVSFYRRKLAEHARPVLWVDVDCRILKAPRMLADCNLDFAGYAQRFRYIREYDPYDSTRFWIPGILFLNCTPATIEFVDLMHAIEQATDERITDDYCLHEAWMTHRGQLNVGLLAPRTVARTPAAADDDTVFVYGASGRVAEFKETVLQHPSRDLLSNPVVADRVKALHNTPAIRAAALCDVAGELAERGDQPTAARLMRTALQIAPDDPKAVRRYAELLRASGERDAAFALLEEFLERHLDDGETRRLLYRLLALYGHLDRAAEQLDGLAAHDDPRWAAYARSARYDLELERRAVERGLSWADRTWMWWMKTPYPGNLGDSLSPYIVEKVSGRPPRFVARDKGVLAIGSIVKFAARSSVVWGSGTARMSDELSADAQYRAVRGPLTRDLVTRCGGDCPEVYGDPGLLLPRFYAPRPAGERYAIGLIRHLVHGETVVRLDGVREISPIRVGTREIESFVDEVASCDAILSTSLHGLITAHAYGVPARWCTFGRSAPVPGDGTKFEDYFRSVDLPSQTPLDLSPFERLDASLLSEVDPRVDLQFSADDLIAAFPR